MRHQRPVQTGARFSGMRARLPRHPARRGTRSPPAAAGRAPRAAARCAVRRTVCLIARSDSGAQARMSASQRPTAASSSARRHDLVDQAHRQRLGGLMPPAGQQHAHRGAMRRSGAAAAPCRRRAAGGRRAARCRPNVASSAATTMSQPSTISSPPPSAWPLTRAITGMSSVVRSDKPPKPVGCAARPVFQPGTCRPRFMSAPAQNARSPAPVSTTARTSRSVSSRCQIVLQRRVGGGVERVQHLRPVDGDAGDVVGDLAADRSRHHAVRAQPRRSSSASIAGFGQDGVAVARRRAGGGVAQRETVVGQMHRRADQAAAVAARRCGLHEHPVDRGLRVVQRLAAACAPARTAGRAPPARAIQCAVRVRWRTRRAGCRAAGAVLACRASKVQKRGSAERSSRPMRAARSRAADWP